VVHVILKKLLVLLCVLSPSFALAAEKRCPPWIDGSRPVVERTYRYLTTDKLPTRQGLALSTPSYYWTRGAWFEMPLGYQNPWIHLPFAKAVAYSGVIRPPVPIASGHPYRFDPAGDSGASGHPKITLV
ncbi:MAG: hypothetical protein MJH10_18130, partial [Epibacterium sp.]|nr:hypothetical protein [Epibacterium sp.]